MTGKEAIKKLQATGWILDRINGSHHIMYKPGHLPFPYTVIETWVSAYSRVLSGQPE